MTADFPRVGGMRSVLMVLLSLIGEEVEPIILAGKWGESGYRHYDLSLSPHLRGWFSPWFLSSLPFYELAGLLWCVVLRLRGVRKFLVQDAVFSGLFVAVVCRVMGGSLYLFDYGSAVNLESGLLEKELDLGQSALETRLQLRIMRVIRFMSIRSARLFFVHSLEMKSLAVRLGLTLQRVVEYQSPVDSGVFRRDSRARLRLRRRLAVEKRFCILYLGRMTLDKGLPLLVEAYRKLVEEFPGRLSLLLVGGGPEEERLRELAVGLEGVLFLGFVEDPARVAELMSATDVFVYPVVFGSGVSVAVLEAMACELPVIVGPASATGEAIDEGKDGFVMREAQASEIVKAVRTLLNDSRLRRRVGRGAREKVVNQFGREAYRETVVRRMLSPS